ncbi:MAG TPA: 3-methyladenine DNA glycosylase [Propionibacteriaceae bacterium]|nr:3-methyladenine DNA glycosylase [Propionibacteriaceae bacterium]
MSDPRGGALASPQATARVSPVLGQHEWWPLAVTHRERAQSMIGEHVSRRVAGQKHPVEDFLFDYYAFRPGHLLRWHPGPGVGLRDASEHASWPSYRTDGGVTSLDLADFRNRRGKAVRFVHDLLVRTHSRPAVFGCFGLHEWAMVYRQDAGAVRHQSLPLRLGAAGTDTFVEAHEIRCTHFDAFRFFTPTAAPRNTLQPTRETQAMNEQPGCLHGGAMDLYRWAFKLSPGIPSDLLLDCFALARTARVLDMRSSPYDTSSLGYPNIEIETNEGKAEHVRQQRAISEASAPLRLRLIDAVATLLGDRF